MTARGFYLSSPKPQLTGHPTRSKKTITQEPYSRDDTNQQKTDRLHAPWGRVACRLQST